MIIRNSILNENSSCCGGAIVNTGHLSVSESKLSSRKAHMMGGAIYNSGTLIVSDSKLSSNKAQEMGGAIYLHENTVRLIISDSEFAANESADGGGAIAYCNEEDVTLNNCIFKDNDPNDVEEYSADDDY